MTKLQVHDHIKVTSFLGTTHEKITNVDSRYAWIKKRRFMLCTLSDGSLVPMDDDSNGMIKYQLVSIRAEKAVKTKTELTHKIIRTLEGNDFPTYVLAEFLTNLNLTLGAKKKEMVK